MLEQYSRQMESDQENSSEDTDDQRSTTGSENPSNVTDEYPNENICDRIQRVTWSNNKDLWVNRLNEDRTLFRMRFKEYCNESCKQQFYVFHQCIENDQFIEKSQMYEDVSEDDEAFFSAVDKRKYKILKTIDWGKVESELTDDSSDNSITQN